MFLPTSWKQNKGNITMNEELYKLSFTAGMNQRYHQNMAENIDNATLVIATLSSLTLLGGILFYCLWGCENKIWNIALGLLLLIPITFLATLPFNKDAIYHSNMSVRWSELRKDVDNLSLLVKLNPELKHVTLIQQQVGELLIRKNELNSMENKPDERELNKAYEAENQARTGFKTVEEYDNYLKTK